jgi:hypothetical protein
MGLLEILNEQSAFGFTGKINVLVKSNGQLFGVVYQNDGTIVDAQSQSLEGLRALYKMIFTDVESQDFLKFIVEPEILKSENFQLEISLDELKSEASKKFQEYIAAKKLRPPDNVKLVIDPEIIVDANQVSPEEYDVLSLLTEWSKVSDVYKYSNLLEYEITNALVSLRRKKAIRVFQN